MPKIFENDSERVADLDWENFDYGERVNKGREEFRESLKKSE